MPRVLNLGGGSKAIPIPSVYDGWEHVLVDVDPRGAPDLVADLRDLPTLVPPMSVDAVYCAHTLEHFFAHDVLAVLRGARGVLVPTGWCHLIVPDVGAVMARVVQEGLELDSVLYTAPVGPILVRDVLWGYHVEIERSGQAYYAHKTGFSRTRLVTVVREAGFPVVYAACVNLEVHALAFLGVPSADAKCVWGI